MSTFTIDIDTGGTFTDGFFAKGKEYAAVKVDTTPHDLTVCFNHCIEEGARRFGFANVNEFLKETKTIRLSTTVGTNSIIQRSGPKLGLIVTEGEEKSLYQQNNPVLDFLVHPDLVVGIKETVSDTGELVTEADEHEARAATKRLLEAGARIIVVSLKNAHLNMNNERKVRRVIQQDFPKHYLGAKPILLAGEVSLQKNDGIRTNAAVVNAYLHRDMVKYLYKADEDVRKKGYTKPLLIAHANGGVARVAKTKAIDTYNSGPAAGLMGSKYIGEIYDLSNILTVDVGGTSTDVGLIFKKELTFDTASKISGIPVHTPLIHVLSVGGGGGSIAGVDKDNFVQVGPKSAGAVPGPACFDLGGVEPTVTDAAVILGLIDPDYFLGGTKRLKREKASQAIERKISSKLNISVEEAAQQIVARLETIGADALRELRSERGRMDDDFVLFSFGGGGGLFSAGMARKSAINKVYTFPFGSVFSAFGLSTADVSHHYQTRTNLLYKKGEGLSSQREFEHLVQKLENSAYRDMRGEGFVPDFVKLRLTFEIVASVGVKETVQWVEGTFSEAALNSALNQICEQLNAGELVIESVQLRSQAAVSRYELNSFELLGKDAAKAVKATRSVYWTDRFLETPVYDLDRIQAGNEIAGPAIIESANTTIVVPEDAVFKMDSYMNGILEV